MFKGGAAFVAIRSGVPVVPLGLIGTREILPRNSKVIHPGKVTVKVGEPVNTEGLTSKDREALAQLLHSKVAELIKGHYGV